MEPEGGRVWDPCHTLNLELVSEVRVALCRTVTFDLCILAKALRPEGSEAEA